MFVVVCGLNKIISDIMRKLCCRKCENVHKEWESFQDFYRIRNVYNSALEAEHYK